MWAKQQQQQLRDANKAGPFGVLDAQVSWLIVLLPFASGSGKFRSQLTFE